MVVAIAVCELHLPAARSLKEKRRVVKSLVEKIHRRYRVSVAETGFHDLHQRAEITIAAVANGEGEINRLMQQLRGIIDGEDEAMVTFWEPQFLEGGR
jgi:uncharacterized protein